MWNVEDDLLKIGTRCPACKGTGIISGRMSGSFPAQENGYGCETCHGKKTVDETRDNCCNLSVVFEIEEIPAYCLADREEGPSRTMRVLNMTVFNRSNDMVYGALGANVVHFSVLQEYMAACIGVEVGTYYQVSSNMHVYLDEKKWKPEKWSNYNTHLQLCDNCYGEGFNPKQYVNVMGKCDGCGEQKVTRNKSTFEHDVAWGTSYPKSFPLVKDPATFDKEVIEFAERHGKDSLAGHYTEPFLRDVAQPMMIAFHHHKRREYNNALMSVETVKADDWKIVATSWVLKRQKMWEKKHDRQD